MNTVVLPKTCCCRQHRSFLPLHLFSFFLVRGANTMGTYKHDGHYVKKSAIVSALCYNATPFDMHDRVAISTTLIGEA